LRSRSGRARRGAGAQGDWVIVAIGDGTHLGHGEASHSGADAACRERVGELFARHVREVAPTVDAIRSLERGPFATAATW